MSKHTLFVLPQVRFVYYPGLPSHPRHTLAQELFSGRGFGGMLAFEVQDGPAADAVLQVRGGAVSSLTRSRPITC